MNGKITISHYHNTKTICISLENAETGITETKIEIDAENFTMALTGTSNRKCTYEKYPNVE